MEGQNMRTIPTAPRNIPGGSNININDVASIIFTNGTRLELNNDASVVGSSSSPHSMPYFASYSSHHQRRDRGASFTSNLSSASSTREAFASLNFQGDRLGTSLHGLDQVEPRRQLSFNSLDLNQYNINESPSKLAPEDGGDFTEAFPDMLDNQDHLVSSADGGDVFGMDDLLNLNELGQLSQPLQPQLDLPSASFDEQYLPQLLLNPQTLSLPSDSNVALTATALETARVRDKLQRSSGSIVKANGRPKSKPGRKRGMQLTAEQKAKTHFQRIFGNCQYCRDTKRKCDAGTPCQHCAKQKIQCRRPMLQSLVNTMLSDEIRWHAYPRTPSNFFPKGYQVLGGRTAIPFKFAFGPDLYAQVQVIRSPQSSELIHRHVIYSQDSSLLARPMDRHDVVLPVQLYRPEELSSMLDAHLTDIVDHHLSEFKLYRSRFRIFDSIVRLFKHYTVHNQEYADLLRFSLKLLVLVHSGDATVDQNDLVIADILRRYAPVYNGTQVVEPCLIRAQLGRIVPALARSLLRVVLDKLIQICASRRSDQHHLVIAVFALVLMTLESIMYLGSRYSFHQFLGDDHASIEDSYAASLANGEKAATDLLGFYRLCFENCHRLMSQTASDQDTISGVPRLFVAELNEAVNSASGYLQEKGESHIEGLQDVSQLFDRLLARLFLVH